MTETKYNQIFIMTTHTVTEKQTKKNPNISNDHTLKLFKCT